MVRATIAAARAGAGELQALLETFPVPIYLTDADGWVTYFNRACIDFAGRTPVAGQDRWCVTWRLHTEGGSSLPHAECPMAVAISEGRPVHGVVAVAERPDGSRVVFTPHATPIIEDGVLAGAVNILIDVTDRRQAEALKAQALRCRRLARSITNTRASETLQLMAAEYDEQASALIAPANDARPHPSKSW